MAKPRLIYFDAPVSRGEEVRLALHLANVDFEDVRIKPPEWASMKSTAPMGSMPILELEGKPPLAQSNAILCLIGRRHGLHPKDDFEAAQHEAIMSYAEELRGQVGPTLRMADAEKKAAREALVATTLPAWGANIEKHLTTDGPFISGNTINVADIKLFAIVRWFNGGKVDHIPATIFDAFPKLTRLHDAVRDHAGVKAWYAKTA